MAFSVLLVAGCEQQEQESTADLYETAVVEYHTIDVNVEAAGIIEPITTVEVKSKASGEILSINAETGDHVVEGTLLVQVDKRTPRNNVDQYQADLDAAIARRKIAITQLDRTKGLLDKGIVTDTEYETAQLELANAVALVISRQVDLENARIALEDTDVKAPISGIIIEKNVERGQVISSPTQDVGGGTILLKMADLSTVQVRTLVDETDIGKIKPGMPVTVRVSAFPNQPFTGEVLKIEPQATVDQNVTMFPVIIRLQNEQGLLRPGMNAEVSISIAHAENVLAVPAMALRTGRDVFTTAAILGMPEEDLKQNISEVAVPPEGKDVQVQSAMEIRRNNQAPGEEQNRGQDTGRFIPDGGNRFAARKDSGTEYQFGGTYWVVVLENGKPVPRTVRTGVTDFGYSEVISGLTYNEQVIILPSADLFERQERLQERISQRMHLPGMGGSH